MKKMIYLKDVVTLSLDVDRCIGCGMCRIVCPHAVFGSNDHHAVILNRDHCMECGACAKNCPTEAITVQAGVGCAAAVINTALGRKDNACCCIIESKPNGILNSVPEDRPRQSACC